MTVTNGADRPGDRGEYEAVKARGGGLPEDLPAIKPPGFVWFQARLNKVAFRNRPNWKVVTFSEMGGYKHFASA